MRQTDADAKMFARLDAPGSTPAIRDILHFLRQRSADGYARQRLVRGNLSASVFRVPAFYG